MGEGPGEWVGGGRGWAGVGVGKGEGMEILEKGVTEGGGEGRRSMM